MEGAMIKKGREIACQMEVLAKSIEVLHDIVDQVEERLAPVLRNEPQSGNVAAEQEALTPLAEDVRRQRQRVEDATGKLQRMLMLLEV